MKAQRHLLTVLNIAALVRGVYQLSQYNLKCHATQSQIRCTPCATRRRWPSTAKGRLQKIGGSGLNPIVYFDLRKIAVVVLFINVPDRLNFNYDLSTIKPDNIAAVSTILPAFTISPLRTDLRPLDGKRRWACPFHGVMQHCTKTKSFRARPLWLPWLLRR